ncbi:MAG: phosphoserine phosphatase, partial [Candidatus Thermoplasmatota archaeon]
RERERALENNPEVRQGLMEAQEAKKKAEELHNRVEELAQKAQEEHEAMLRLYDQCDAVRREADRAQADFIKTKMAADNEHRRHIELIKQVHDYDKIIAGLLQKRRMERRGRDEVDEKRAAEDIYERFKKGEKLSTEDLMCLQKSGYI